MKRVHPRMSAITTGLFALWISGCPLLASAASLPSGATPPGTVQESYPTKEIVKKYIESCLRKPIKEADCEKVRKGAVEILKEDLLTLGSTADRAYLPRIVRMFKSDEVELRIAAADAIGMIGPQEGDLEMLAPLTNDPVPDVRQAASQMIARGEGSALTLLKERTMPMRTGRMPEAPVDAGKYSMPVAPDSTYLFDSSDASVGRLSYVTKGKSDPAAFYKVKAKKGPFKLEEFQQKYRFQIQDEQKALAEAQQAAGREIENTQPPDPTNVQAYREFMQKIASVGASQGSRTYLDSYQPNLFGSPTVYVLEERQIGKRSYPTRYVVVYQEQALKRPGYRLSWMTVSDSMIKVVQETSLQEEQQEETFKKENAALKKKEAELEALTKKKDEAESKKFKKGQADLEKELGF